jgi:hypothetical protein
MTKSHLLLPLILILLALGFLDPLGSLMLGMTAEIVLGLLVLATVVYGALLFKESVQDEREIHIRSVAHRATYLVSVGGLVAIMAYYLITKGHVYPETVILLVAIVITKTIVHWYGERNL